MVIGPPVVLGLVLLVTTLVLLAIRRFQRARIIINDGRTMEVPTGSTLLEALAANGIHLPGTCGGQGTCAQCKCQVLKGGKGPSERELPFFSSAQLADHWRLACQVKVRGTMTVTLPLAEVGITAPMS